MSAWHADAARIDAQLKELSSCKGHLSDSAARFKQCLDLQADLSKRSRRLSTYSSEQAAEDTGNPAFLKLDPQSDLLGARRWLRG